MPSNTPGKTVQIASIVSAGTLVDRGATFAGSVESTALPIMPSETAKPAASSCCGGGCGSGEKMPRPQVTTETVAGHCESCGKTSQFPPDRDGKIEECPHCHEFLDVGELGWEMTDFGEPLD